MIAGILLVYSFFLPALLQNIIGSSMALKLTISIIIIAIPSVLMGIPFPMGLKLLAAIEEKNTAWAWGINGCMSVISAALAALLAVEAGFMIVMLLAVLAYALSLLATFSFPRSI